MAATVAVELNAATDNPLVLVGEGIVVSNGNFHGQPLAFGLDALAMAVSELANISERRVERLVNPSLSEGLPPFLTLEGGLDSGFMIPQYVAAALVSESKSLCHPASVDSIPTSAGQEDHVWMGNAAGLKALQVLANSERALAIELLAGAQASSSSRRSSRGRACGRPRRRARAVRARARRPFALGGHRARGSRGRGRLDPRGRRGGRWGSFGERRPPPLPKRPYRDGVLLNLVLAGLILVISWLTGGELRASASCSRSASSSSRPRGRGGGSGSAWSGSGDEHVSSLDAQVEALVGDLSAIRAPRGTQLNARSWQTEAPLRMLLNNLDPEVAERPEELVVYGGSGRAARSHEALKAIVRTLLRLRDDETLLVQSGKPVGVFRTHEGAPRVLIANSLLVPRWANWDEFRRLEAEGLTMFGQMTAGSWIYIGTQGILQGTYQTFAAAGEKHFGSADLSGRTILTAGLGGMGGAQPLAATMAGAAILCIEVDPSRIQRRLETRYLDEVADSLEDGVARVRAAAAEGRALSVAVLGNAAEIVPELSRSVNLSTSSPTRRRPTIR